ncbi:hypothetical protein A1332_14765 [Methylomonas methanica]|uniref:Uncharacterized protein n=1 Tax=Methylomonas methanica TaxID=421 RepID=A0A177MEP1_METMH|nr:hypothetical protein A1332_14765 [Methylomonas methanica]
MRLTRGFKACELEENPYPHEENQAPHTTHTGMEWNGSMYCMQACAAIGHLPTIVTINCKAAQFLKTAILNVQTNWRGRRRVEKQLSIFSLISEVLPFTKWPLF